MVLLLMAAVLAAGMASSQVSAKDPGADDTTTTVIPSNPQPSSGTTAAPSIFTASESPAAGLELAANKSRIRLYVKSDCRWRKLVGKHCASPSKLAFKTRSVAYTNWSLKKWKRTSKHDHLQARTYMVKQTKVHTTHISQLQMALGISKPMRVLADAGSIEARFNQSRHLDRKLTKQWNKSSLFNALKCIHSKEGAWNSVSNSNPRYYGGMQADMRFQQQYGPEFLAKWGTADNWPVWAQLVMATRAVRGWVGPDPATRAARGYYPWPNTAHDCGLI